MNTYAHPQSGEKIQGMKLAPGAKIQESDFYDSTSGRWIRCPSAGGTVPEGGHVIWVRQNAELSEDARALLQYMATSLNFLTHRNHWKAIPDPSARYDERLDWEMPHPECVQDLIDFGFLEAVPANEIDYGTSFDSNAAFRTPQENETWRVSEAGHAFVKSISN